LTDKRRVQVSEFKGMQMVAIREFYEKDGEMLPAKKVTPPPSHCISSPFQSYTQILVPFLAQPFFPSLYTTRLHPCLPTHPLPTPHPLPNQRKHPQ